MKEMGEVRKSEKVSGREDGGHAKKRSKTEKTKRVLSGRKWDG